MHKPKVVIVDYGCGNLFSIQRALAEVGTVSAISRSGHQIREADKVILPGVGAFGDGMKNLRDHGLLDATLDFASSGKPLLGICLGMQLFLRESFEFGHHKGLGLIPGKVIRLSEGTSDEIFVKIPHIGWNSISFLGSTAAARNLLRGLENRPYMYFIHSYYVSTDSAQHCIATAEYGVNRFCAAVAKDNILGVQFHPEISGPAGLQLLKNFAEEV